MYSIILTVHNKDFLIERVIRSIFLNTSGSYELIIVVDGCTDKSEEIILATIQGKDNCKVIYTPDVFEVKANNVGLKQAENKYCIIVQDDCVINEYAWNERMAKPFSIDNVFTVTSNTSHNWKYNPNNQSEFNEIEGWSDILIHCDHANRNSIGRDTFAVRDSVNRSPLMLRKDILEKLNYLDEEFYPLDSDDHDLCYRSKQLGVIVGCYWIDYISDQSWGGTRVSGQTANWVYEANRKNTRLLWNRHKDLILNNRTVEDIICK